MARIRTIKPEYWSNEKVMNCSRSARLLFIGLWNFADDDGRCIDSAKTIKAQILPGDDDVNSEMVRGMIDELSANDLVQKYEVDGRAYLQITGWNHQKIDKPKPSKLPPPDSTNDRRSVAPDLILSNLTISNLKSAQGERATALPTGALARPLESGADPPKEAWRRKAPSAVRRGELAELYEAAKQKPS